MGQAGRARVELRHIRYFVAVAEELNFGRAAERLHISQPPLSTRVRELEREMGVTLLHRTTRQVELTPAGELFLDRARAVLAAVEVLDRDVRAHAAAAEATVRLGVLPELNPAMLARFEAGMRARGLVVETHELSSAEQLAGLRDGGLDLGLVLHTGRFVEPQCVVFGQLRKALGVVLPKAHPLAGRPAVRLGDLDGESLILFERRRAPDVHDRIIACCQQRGFRPRRLIYSGPLDGILVATGQAVLLHTADFVRGHDGLCWLAVDGAELSWQAALVSRRPPAGWTGAVCEAFTQRLVAEDHWELRPSAPAG